METAKKGGKFAAKSRKCVARQANETGNVRSHRVLGFKSPARTWTRQCAPNASCSQDLRDNDSSLHARVLAFLTASFNIGIGPELGLRASPFKVFVR
jgi:hypothetical protein